MDRRIPSQRIGWLIVGIVLAGSGLRHIWSQEIYSKVHLAGSVPLLQGWPVVLIGLLELAAGVYLIVRMRK